MVGTTSRGVINLMVMDRLRGHGMLFFLSFVFLAMPGCTGASDATRELLFGQSFRDESIRRAHDIRVASQELVILSGEAAKGIDDSFEEIAVRRESMDEALEHLHGSAGLRGCDKFLDVRSAWVEMRANVNVIIDSRQRLAEFKTASDRFEELALELSSKSGDLVSLMAELDSPDRQMLFASRQADIADRLGRRLTDITNGVDQRETLARDLWLFGRVLEGFRTGQSEFGVARLPEKALGLLGAVESSFKQLEEAGVGVNEYAPSVFAVKSAQDDLHFHSIVLLDKANTLVDAIYSADEGSECAVH